MEGVECFRYKFKTSYFDIKKIHQFELFIAY